MGDSDAQIKGAVRGATPSATNAEFEEETTLATLAFGRVGTTLVLALGDHNPSASDWSIWTAACVHAGLEHGVRRLFVTSGAGGPTAAQRREVMSALGRTLGVEVGEAARAAVCSDSPTASVISMALCWLYGLTQMRVFARDQHFAAFRFLGLDVDEDFEIMELARRLEREFCNGG